MRTQQNSVPNTTGAMVLSMLAGWAPAHRSLEAEAAELADLAERDNAARVALQRHAGGGHMAEQLSFGLIVTDPQAHRAEAAKKQRRCLSCSSTFNSAGPGNRICGRCRSLEHFTCSPVEYSLVTASF